MATTHNIREECWGMRLERWQEPVLLASLDKLSSLRFTLRPMGARVRVLFVFSIVGF